MQNGNNAGIPIELLIIAADGLQDLRQLSRSFANRSLGLLKRLRLLKAPYLSRYAKISLESHESRAIMFL